MYEAFWNGLFDTRLGDAPLGPEAIRVVRKLRTARLRTSDDRPWRCWQHITQRLEDL